jgi:hypothetical protein
MIPQYNRASLWWGIPGLLLRWVGVSVLGTAGVVIILVGTIMLTVGLMYYAKAKARHSAWCLMGFAGLIGLIVLALLEDRAREVDPRETNYALACACGAENLVRVDEAGTQRYCVACNAPFFVPPRSAFTRLRIVERA